MSLKYALGWISYAVAVVLVMGGSIQSSFFPRGAVPAGIAIAIVGLLLLHFQVRKKSPGPIRKDQVIRVLAYIGFLILLPGLFGIGISRDNTLLLSLFFLVTLNSVVIFAICLALRAVWNTPLPGQDRDRDTQDENAPAEDEPM